MEEAKRYQCEAPLDSLPSECLKSLQAMKALRGMRQWWETLQLVSDTGYDTAAQPKSWDSLGTARGPNACKIIFSKATSVGNCPIGKVLGGGRGRRACCKRC